MAIFKSSNHAPNLTEIDVTDNNTFTAQVNTSGEPIKAYKLTIMSGDASDTIYDGTIQTLTTTVKNKGTLEIPNVSSSTSGMSGLTNGKDYQWGVRMYNQAPSASTQPNTVVCSGYLVGSTKYVTWVRIADHGEGGVNKEVADNLVYDRYIEYTAADASELIIGAHEADDKEKPAATQYPYIQRKKIDWVEKELGTDEDFIKIETEEEFDYDYPDGHQFTIYKCSSDHTVTSAFADPNTNINVSDYIIIYNSVADALTAFNAGDNPEEIKSNITPAFTKRKITGYSSDTGEIRVHDAWLSAPTNGMAYRIFEQDVSTKEYTELFCSDIIYKVKAGSPYYTLTAPVGAVYYSPTVPSGTKYYSVSGSTTTEEGTLTEITSCTLNDMFNIAGTSVMCSDITLTTLSAPDGISLYDTTVGTVDYFSDPELTDKVGTLTETSTPCIYCTEAISTIYDTTTGKTYYVATLNTLGTLLATDTGRTVTKITDTYSKVTFTRDTESKEAFVKTSELTSTTGNYIVPSVNSGTLASETTCTFKTTKYCTVKVGTKTYQIVTIPGGVVAEGDNYVASNVTGDGGTIVVGGVSQQVAFSSLQAYIGEAMISNPFEAQVIGGRPITSEYFKSVSNRWDDTEPPANKRIFIQPNVNIKTDSTNPNEIVFNNGCRVDIVKQTSTIRGKTVDVTFNKLDNSQWLLEWNAITSATGNRPPKTDGEIIPQTDYKVYTDFMDTAPLNLIYAREKPTLTLQCKNYYYEANGKTFDVSTPYYIPIGTAYYKDTAFSKWENGDTIYIPANTKCYTDPELTIPADPPLLTSGTNGTYQTSVYSRIGSAAPYIYVSTPSRVTTAIIPENDNTQAYYTVTDPDGVTTRYIKQSAVKETPTEYINMSDKTYNYRDMAFKTVLSYTPTSTEIHPQVKYYTYYLYDEAGNLISQSEDTYSIDIEWHFRGMETGKDYTIKIEVVDEYGKKFEQTQKFSIEYATQKSLMPLNLSYDCHEHALKIDVVNMLYVETTDYTDTEYGTYATVTDANFHWSNQEIDYLEIPEAKTLNYTNINNEEETPIYIPSTSSVLTQFQITGSFIEDIPNAEHSYGPDGSYSKVLAVGHQFSDDEMSKKLEAIRNAYNSDANNNIDYSNIKALPVDTETTLSQSNPVQSVITDYIYPETEGSPLTLEGVDYYLIFNTIKTDGTLYDDMATYVAGLVPATDPTLQDIIDADKGSRKLLLRALATDTKSDAEEEVAEMKELLDEAHYLLNNNNVEEYTMVMTNINSYYYNDDHRYRANENIGEIQFYRNNDIYNPVSCFGGTHPTYYDIGAECGEKFVSQKEMKFALQSNKVYAVVDRLPTEEEGIDTAKKYVLLNTYLIYTPGIYQYDDDTNEWAQNYNEDFVVVGNDDELPGGVQPTGFITDAVSEVYDATTGTYKWQNSGTISGEAANSLYIINEGASSDINKAAFDNTWFTLYMLMDSTNATETERLQCQIIYKEGGKN